MDARPARLRWPPEGLPATRGWGRWPFLAVWSTLLAMGLWGAALTVHDLRTQVTTPISAHGLVGLQFDPDVGAPVLGLPIGEEARRSGIRKGDRLVAVDGRPAGSGYDAIDRQLVGRIGTTVAVSVADATGSVREYRLTRDPAHVNDALRAAGLNLSVDSLITQEVGFLFSVVLVLACAIMLMVWRARDRLAPWASLMMLMMVLGNSPSGGSLLDSPSLAYTVFNGGAYGLLAMVLATFPDGRLMGRWSPIIAIGAMMLAIASAPLPGGGRTFVLVVAETIAVGLIGVRFRRMPQGTERQQIRWALLGFGASVITLLLSALCFGLRAYTSDFAIQAWARIAASVFGSMTTLLTFAGITASLLRYRLYDADATISRSIAYGTLTLTLLGIFAGSERVIELLGEEYLGGSLGALAGGLGAAVAAVCVGPIHHRVTHWAEKRFRNGLVRLRDGLPLLVGDMRETATPAALADAMLARVEVGVRARHAAVVFGGTVLDEKDVARAAVEEWLGRGKVPVGSPGGLDCDRRDPLFPMRVPLHADGVGLVGWLLLGPRPDGSFYGRDEREALHEIADPVARALAIAHQRERRDNEQRQRDEARTRENAYLRRALRRLEERLGLDAFGENATA